MPSYPRVVLWAALLVAALFTLVPPHLKPASRVLITGSPPAMRAAVYRAYGEARAVLSVVDDRPFPQVAPHEVRRRGPTYRSCHSCRSCHFCRCH